MEVDKIAACFCAVAEEEGALLIDKDYPHPVHRGTMSHSRPRRE